MQNKNLSSFIITWWEDNPPTPIHSSNQSLLDLGVKINYSYENLIHNLVTRVCGCRADVLRINLSAENTAVSKKA